jgi:O-antigen/teichoic acid export membrane protein
MTAPIGSPAGPVSDFGQRASAGRQFALASVIATWRRNTDVLANAGTLVATTGVSSLLGFAYWAVAARLSSQQAVGYGSAAVSAMTLIGTIGMLGLGTVLIGELPRRTARAGLVSAALLTSGAGSLALGLVFAVAAPHVSETFTRMTGTPLKAVLFAAGVAFTGATLVFDQAAVGLMRGGLQLWRNSAFAVAKLLVLPAAAIVLHDQAGLGITLSWVAGTAVSALPVALRLRLSGTNVLPRPDWAVLRRLGRAAVAHNWLNLAIQVPRLLMPVLVTIIVSPAANAAFYAAWTLSGFLYIVPTHLATALFAVAAGDARAIARKLRLTLRLSMLIGLPAMAVLGFGAHLALSLFGASYAAAATVPLWLLVIGYLPVVPKLHYIAVCRATDQVPRAALVLSLAAAAEVAAATAGGLASGLKGLSVALLAVFALEGLVTGPRVLRAALGRGRHTGAASAQPPGGSPGRHRHSNPGYAGPQPLAQPRR